MTSKSEPPAPPPCEIEEEICSCHVDSHFHAANHHAEIAELRARIKGMAVKYERQSKMNGSLSLVGAVRVAKELRAALAPKENPSP